MSDVLLKLDEKPCLKGVANDEALKQELLAAQIPECTDGDRPKKGTKLYIVSQIEHLCGTAGIPVTESNRELMRQGKAELKRTLAKYMEIASERRMKAHAGLTAPLPVEEEESSDNRKANIMVLRLLHDCVLGGVERAYEAYGSGYTGITIEGLTSRLQEEPHTSRVDEILVEIATEQPELLDMFESPYARLALCWLMAAVAVGRSKTNEPLNGHRNGNIPPLPGHGAAALGRRPAPSNGRERVQPPDLRAKKGGEVLLDKPTPVNAGGAGASGHGDSSVRGKRPVQQADGKVLRPEVLLQGVAGRDVQCVVEAAGRVDKGGKKKKRGDNY